MRTPPLISVILLVGLAPGCAVHSAKPVEVLDERTGMTLGVLKEPLEFVPLPGNAGNAVPMAQRGTSLASLGTTFAYLGPVEWNRAGTFSYGLWMHIAPGNGKPVGDIRAAGSVTVVLDDGPITLSPMEAPKGARDGYEAAASWGQTAHFDATIGMFRRMAASHTLELDVRATDGTIIKFAPTLDTHAALMSYLRSRELIAD